MKRLLIFCVAVMLFVPALVQADSYIRTKTSTTGFAGLGGTKGKTESWISGKKQIEVTKIEIKSPLLKAFMDGSEEATITDLERGVITTMDFKEKEYSELSFEEMREQLKQAQKQMKEHYEGAKQNVEEPMPEVSGGEISIESHSTGEKKKFAGLQGERTTLVMRSKGKDKKSGEEVTYKVVYDAWMTPEIPGGEDRRAFAEAYADAFMVSLEENIAQGQAGMMTALQSAGLTPEQLGPHMKGLEGYPLKFTVSIGTELTAEQKKEFAEAMKKQESKKKSGGGFSLGSIKKKVTDAAGAALSDAMVETLFGEGVMMDADGDPVFFSLTSEVEKVENKSVDPKRFQVPDNFTTRASNN